VRHPARKLPKRFQSLRLGKGGLGFFARRHLMLKLGKGRHKGPTCFLTLDGRAIERILQLDDFWRTYRD
jgi:hypothetical protein